MAVAQWMLIGVTLLTAGGVARAGSNKDLDEIMTHLTDDDTVEQTYGALAVQHYARQQWGFSLFSHAELRPWQRELAPAVKKLIDLLTEDEGLEWVDPNGNQKQTTTPRQEAWRALLAVERAAVDPLVAALDRPPLARKADELLRKIVRGGHPQHDRAAWQAWWQQNQRRPLPNEHGQWWLVALGLLALGGMAAVVFRVQRAGKG